MFRIYRKERAIHKSKNFRKNNQLNKVRYRKSVPSKKGKLVIVGWSSKSSSLKWRFSCRWKV